MKSPKKKAKSGYYLVTDGLNVNIGTSRKEGRELNYLIGDLGMTRLVSDQDELRGLVSRSAAVIDLDALLLSRQREEPTGEDAE